MTWDLEARDKQLWSPRQEGGPGRPYLWLCDPPPWGTCPLPTTCASGFPGGCSPAAGEWPDQTRPERRSLGVTGEPKTQDVSAPSASLCSLARPQPPRRPPCPCSAGGKGLGCPQEHGSPLCSGWDSLWRGLCSGSKWGTRYFFFPSLHADWHAQPTAKTPLWVK